METLNIGGIEYEKIIQIEGHEKEEVLAAAAVYKDGIELQRKLNAGETEEGIEAISQLMAVRDEIADHLQSVWDWLDTKYNYEVLDAAGYTYNIRLSDQTPDRCFMELLTFQEVDDRHAAEVAGDKFD